MPAYITIATELFINKHTQEMFLERHQLNIFNRMDEVFVFSHRKVKFCKINGADI